MYTSLLQLGMSVIISGVGCRSTLYDTSDLLSARRALSITSARIRKKNGAINRRVDARRFRQATSAACVCLRQHAVVAYVVAGQLRVASYWRALACMRATRAAERTIFAVQGSKLLQEARLDHNNSRCIAAREGV